MNRLISIELPIAELILFRLGTTYLAFYFLFISNYFFFLFPVLNYVQAPLHYVSSGFISTVNNLFIHKEFDGNITLDDNYWLFVATISYFVLSVLVTAIWTSLSKSKSHTRLFHFQRTYCRYYLAFVLFVYGFAKLLGNQFAEPSPEFLIKPLGDFDAQSLLWAFMGVSRAYNFFGGLVEVVAGGLLLFRRTSTFGALLAIGTLINVLMLNIGYDTMVKVFAFHLILIGTYIISDDIKPIFRFFFVKNKFALSRPDVGIGQNLPSSVRFFCKAGLIGYVTFIIIGYQFKKTQGISLIAQADMDGIYEITDFQQRPVSNSVATDDKAVEWKRIAMNSAGYFTVQFATDSLSIYNVKIDTSFHSLQLSSWYDSTFKSTLYYTHKQPNEYNFEGIFDKDTIRLFSNKVDLGSKPLLKNKGKVKWTWD